MDYNFKKIGELKGYPYFISKKLEVILKLDNGKYNIQNIKGKQIIPDTLSQAEIYNETYFILSKGEYPNYKIALYCNKKLLTGFDFDYVYDEDHPNGKSGSLILEKIISKKVKEYYEFNLANHQIRLLCSNNCIFIREPFGENDYGKFRIPKYIEINNSYNYYSNLISPAQRNPGSIQIKHVKTNKELERDSIFNFLNNLNKNALSDIIELRYQNNYACLINNKWGIMNLKGEEKIPFNYVRIITFENTIALITQVNKK